MQIRRLSPVKGVIFHSIFMLMVVLLLLFLVLLIKHPETFKAKHHNVTSSELFQEVESYIKLKLPDNTKAISAFCDRENLIRVAFMFDIKAEELESLLAQRSAWTDDVSHRNVRIEKSMGTRSSLLTVPWWRPKKDKFLCASIEGRAETTTYRIIWIEKRGPRAYRVYLQINEPGWETSALMDDIREGSHNWIRIFRNNMTHD